MPEPLSIAHDDQARLLRKAVSEEALCDLCGLPLGGSKTEEVIGEEMVRFCCPGCKQVFLLLATESGCLPAAFKETEIYRVCVESGIIPGGSAGFAAASSVDPDPDLPPLELTVRVEGMWCPACAWLIEEVLRRTAGVLEPRVSFFSDLAQVKYLPHVISPVEIQSRISRLGYSASPFLQKESVGAGKKDLLARLGVSAILTANVMMLSLALYFGFFGNLSRTVIGYFSYPLLVIATPVVFYGGLPILRKASAGLRYGSTSMDTLISLGTLAAYFYSLVQMARGSIHLYFDTACMLVTLVLLGRYVETAAREKVSSGIAELYELAGQKVRFLAGAGERWVHPDAVKPADRFVVRSDERSPVDGRIVTGRAVLDESILTGESRPVQKGPGDEVMAGSLVREGELVLTVSRVGPDSTLHQLISLVQEALDKKNPVELLADRITRVFVPIILAIAGTAALLLWLRHVPADEILLRSLTVLLISCPCALGIATPLVKVAMIGVGRSKGILIRNAGALERAKDLDVLVLDKTGTVTEGSFALQRVVAKGLSEQEVLSRLAALENHSSHFLAREVVRRAHELGVKPCEATGVEEFEGRGVRGMVQTKETVVGNRRFMQERGISIPMALDGEAAARERSGRSVIFFAWERSAKGILVFGDPVREGARELIDRLRDRGVATWLVSGDARETTAAVAASLGIEQFLGQVLPAEKADFIGSLMRGGRKVGMVGDGLNDAAALARADVGITFGAGANSIREASDVAILFAEPARILDVLDMSDLATQTIRQNLSVAFFYNAVAIPLAISGLLNPLIAVVAMFGSSFFVIGNALRIARTKRAGRSSGRRPVVATAGAEGNR